mmetsp:Transcript_42974/g.104466  ORF Transcript_42974/g.104466 Transcript_42974/m.104466 type:complete len:367 (+) Transcript_42974:24-1124(+)
MKRGGVTGMFAQSKRVRQAEAARLIGRLCDLKDAAYVFFDDHAAGLAKERGLLRSWTATEKYRDLEKQLLDILRESHGIDAIDERQLRETIPNELLPESAEALVQQVLRHQRYENAARELALEAIEEAQVEHERAMHKLKLEHETEITRVKVSCDMRSTADVEAIGDHLQQTREDYDEKVTNLENKVTLLKSKLEEAAAKQHEVESKAREQLEEMEDALQEMQERVAKAEEERDLKREAAHKLKEEVIGNDRLTVANLNRIKSLEADLQEQMGTIEQLEHQNAELRERADEDQAEVDSLKEVLQERERQILQLSHKLEVREAMTEMHNNTGRIDSRESTKDNPSKERRDSFLDRFGKGSPFASSLI